MNSRHEARRLVDEHGVAALEVVFRRIVALTLLGNRDEATAWYGVYRAAAQLLSEGLPQAVTLH